jgi:hypothetical protein
MQIGGKKIWGSTYQQKKLFYQPGQYAKSLNRAASNQFFNNQKSAISNFFSISSENTYSSLELTLKGIQQRNVAEIKKSITEVEDMKSSIDIKA